MKTMISLRPLWLKKIKKSACICSICVICVLILEQQCKLLFNQKKRKQQNNDFFVTIYVEHN